MRAPAAGSSPQGEIAPFLTSSDSSGCGDWGREALEALACPGGRSGIAPLLSLGPGPLYRASEETEWPPGGNLGAQRVGAGIYVLAKNNSDPARLLLGPGAAPVGGGPPRRLWPRASRPGRPRRALPREGPRPARTAGPGPPPASLGPGPGEQGADKGARRPPLQPERGPSLSPRASRCWSSSCSRPFTYASAGHFALSNLAMSGSPVNREREECDFEPLVIVRQHPGFPELGESSL